MFKIFLAVSLSSLTILAFAGNRSEETTKVPAQKKKAKVSMTFEQCCEEEYGDSFACQKYSHVTQKTKKVNGKAVKKECDEYSAEDEGLLDE